MNQETHGDQGQRLDTWSQIAAYLGCSVRKVQEDEKQKGLPVYRYKGNKSRVFAHPAELGEWRKQQIADRSSSDETKRRLNSQQDKLESNSIHSAPVCDAELPESIQDEQSSVRQQRPTRQFLWQIGIGVVILTLGAAAVATAFHQGPPDHFEVHDREIRMLDRGGRHVWRTMLPLPFSAGWTPEIIKRRSWIGSLSGIPGTSFLFTYSPDPVRAHGSELHCYDEAGHLQWTFRPGRAVTDGWRTYTPQYGIFQVLVLSGAANTPSRIVVMSSHVESYPYQVAVLDSNGTLRSEYWHSGHLFSIAVADIDGDGKPEILLAGVNNGYHQATLVVLDPERIQGASVQTPDPLYQLRGFAPGQEKAIVRFPRDRMNQKFFEFNRAYDLLVTSDSIAVVISETTEVGGAYVLYHLSRQLQLQSTEESNGLRDRYRELVAEGKLDHEFTDLDREELKHIEVIKRY